MFLKFANIDSDEGYDDKNALLYNKENKTLEVIGQSLNYNRNGSLCIYDFKWNDNHEKILNKMHQENDANNINLLLLMPSIYSAPNYHNGSMLLKLTSNDDGLTSTDKPLTAYNFMDMVIKDEDDYTDNDKIIIINHDKYEQYNTYLKAANNIDTLYTKYPIYTKIIMKHNDKPVMYSLLDVLFECIDDSKREQLLTTFAYVNFDKSDDKALTNLAEQVLDYAQHMDGYELMTQEEQVEAFINFSKLVSSQEKEIVSDNDIEVMKSSPAYQHIKEQLTAHGFGLSKTQQFNVFQTVGYFSHYLNKANANNNSIMHNLSDMGAGKTLMTVESIYLMDLNAAHNFNHDDEYDDYRNRVNQLQVPNKNLIAPLLSVESSWVDTFKLFYNVKKISDNQYELSFNYENTTFYSYLNVSGFTVTNTGIKVSATLPKPLIYPEYLVIDEIHQLLDRPISERKFFDTKDEPIHHYLNFVLSGTLSNLTTTQWFNYIRFMGIPFGDSELDTDSARAMKDDVSSEIGNLKDSIKQSTENISTSQHRYFDTERLNNPQMDINEDNKVTNMRSLFDAKYAAKLIDLYQADGNIENSLLNGDYSIKVDDNINSMPNFELFYQIVGSCAITAQSTTIAKELFGEQKQQHPADVINVASPLNKDDIQLLQALHQMAADYQLYKSPAIATKINNAILNLNDGLGSQSIYDIVEKAANHNMRFLKYLSGLNIDILKRLPESNLIQKPKLETTRKFEILQDILKKDAGNTFLIIVNDADAMMQLTKALNIKSLTKKDLKDPLEYQNVLDDMFKQQSIVVVPQAMIKSSLDLIQANRLVQYQLNTEISDIIQTQNRINRIGQTRETKAYYIATDSLQKNVIDLFLETYKNIRVAHKGIVELFVDMSTQVNVINDYIGKAVDGLSNTDIKDITDEADEADKFEFNEEGEMDMLPKTKVNNKSKDSNDDSKNTNQGEVIDIDENNQQMDMFSPDEFAMRHQLAPNND